MSYLPQESVSLPPLECLLTSNPRTGFTTQEEGNKEKTFNMGQTGWGVSLRVLAEKRGHAQKGLFKRHFNEKKTGIYRGASKYSRQQEAITIPSTEAAGTGMAFRDTG